MNCYRVVQDENRTTDLSGTGSFRYGGRWNSKGTYMLYTSENSSLAYLESLVHFDKILIPPKLYIVHLRIDDRSPIYTMPVSEYVTDWKRLSLPANQKQGNQWMKERKYLVIKVRSAINSLEYNYLVNPLFPTFTALVKVIKITEIEVDERFF